MIEYTVHIYKKNKIEPMFVKANSLIVGKYSEEIANSQNQLLTLNTAWNKEFNANIDFNNKSIIFNSYRDMTMFLLKWG